MLPTHSGQPPLDEGSLFAPAPTEIGSPQSVEGTTADAGGLIALIGPFAVVLGGVCGVAGFFLTAAWLHSSNPAMGDLQLMLSAIVVGAIAGVGGYLGGQRWGSAPPEVKELTYIGLRGAARVYRVGPPDVVCFRDVARVQVEDRRRDDNVVERTWTFIDFEGKTRFTARGQSTLQPSSLDPAHGKLDLAWHFGAAVAAAVQGALANPSMRPPAPPSAGDDLD